MMGLAAGEFGNDGQSDSDSDVMLPRKHCKSLESQWKVCS
jgi:hypothetical protein